MKVFGYSYILVDENQKTNDESSAYNGTAI